jgi:DNA repair and recombination protein RAD52
VLQLQGQATKPLSSLPSHMRPEVSMATSTPNGPTTCAVNLAQHQENPSRPQSNAQERRIHNVHPQSPLPEPEPEPDESFMFNSEDDAFLAAVDMGEGELGRPIGEGDVDFGRPIEFEVDVGGHGNKGDTHSNNSVLQEQQSRPQQPRYEDQNQHPTANRAQAPEPNPGRSDPLSSSKSSSTVPQRAAGPGNVVNQNQNSATSNVKSGAAERSTTPSMGGFHFPPGVVRRSITRVR